MVNLASSETPRWGVAAYVSKLVVHKQVVAPVVVVVAVVVVDVFDRDFITRTRNIFVYAPEGVQESQLSSD